MNDLIIEFLPERCEYMTYRRSEQSGYTSNKTTLADFLELNEKREANGLSPIEIPPEIPRDIPKKVVDESKLVKRLRPCPNCGANSWIVKSFSLVRQCEYCGTEEDKDEQH